MQVTLGRVPLPVTKALDLISEVYNEDITLTIKSLINDLNIPSLQGSSELCITVDNDDEVFWGNYTKLQAVMEMEKIPEISSVIMMLVLDKLCAVMADIMLGNECHPAKPSPDTSSHRNNTSSIDQLQSSLIMEPTLRLEVIPEPVDESYQPSQDVSNSIACTELKFEIKEENPCDTDYKDYTNIQGTDEEICDFNLNSGPTYSRDGDSIQVVNEPVMPTETLDVTSENASDYSQPRNIGLEGKNKSRFAHVQKCELCGRIFATARGLNRHRYETHKIPRPTVWRCDVCDKDYKCEAGLRRHKKNKHGIFPRYKPISAKRKTSGTGKADDAHLRKAGLISVQGHSLDSNSNNNNEEEASEKFGVTCDTNDTVTVGLESGKTSDSGLAMKNENDEETDPLKTEKKKRLKHNHVPDKNVTDKQSLFCEICGIVCSNAGSLTLHKIKIHNIPRQTKWRCDPCDKVFKFQSGLCRHNKEHHSHVNRPQYKPATAGQVKSEHTDSAKEDIGDPGDSSDTLTFRLTSENSAVGIEFDNEDKALESREPSEEEPKSANVTGGTDDSDDNVVTVGLGDICACEECGQQFGSPDKLSLHMRGHDRKRSYKCSVCAKGYTTKRCRDQHEITSHYTAKKIKCHLCPATFNTKPLQMEHLLAKHNTLGTREEGKFSCELCDRKFVNQDFLDKHFKTHTAEYNDSLMCKICGKVFATRASVRAHVRSVHIRQRDHQCDLCGVTFLTLHAMRAHRLRHGEKKLVCSACGKRFHTRIELDRHTYIRHTREKPHKCDVCNCGFDNKKRLRSHRQIHKNKDA